MGELSTRDLLRIYDEQLRTDAETPTARTVISRGPLRLATYGGGRGFVTYRDLAGADAATIRRWVAETAAHFRDDPQIVRVEWKTRGHDHAPGLHDALLEHGFSPEEPESIMLGPARLLAVDVVLPQGVRLRRVETEADIRAMSAMADVAFGDPVRDAVADELLERLALDDGMQLWVAESDAGILSAGRLEPVAGSEVAGIWGGATLPQWRGRGLTGRSSRRGRARRWSWDATTSTATRPRAPARSCSARA